MTELKTLEDLKDYEFLKLDDGFMEGHKFKDNDDLKAEAVKCKSRREELIKEGIKIEDLSKIDFNIIMAIPFIDWFFNLTEEDLK